MSETPFVRPVTDLPRVRLPYDTGVGHALVSQNGAVVFVYFTADTDVPEHAHGEQWGVVVQGELLLSIRGRVSTLHAGDCYVIEANEPHGAHAAAGTALIDFFVEQDRFTVESREMGS